MNWVFDGTLQYLEDPQTWIANARDVCDSWVYVKIKRMPFCYVEEIDPDELIQEMTINGGYECFFFAEKKNKSGQAHIGWIKVDDKLWPFVKKSRVLKMLFCRTKQNCSENFHQTSPSASV